MPLACFISRLGVLPAFSQSKGLRNDKVLQGALNGLFYVISSLFSVLAVIMTPSLDFAPVEYGIVWGCVLIGLGFHFRRIERQGNVEGSLTGCPPPDNPRADATPAPDSGQATPDSLPTGPS